MPRPHCRRPTAIGINWTLFQGVFDAIDTPLVNAVNGILTALLAM